MEASKTVSLVFFLPFCNAWVSEWVCVVRWLSANGYDLGLDWERKESH